MARVTVVALPPLGVYVNLTLTRNPRPRALASARLAAADSRRFTVTRPAPLTATLLDPTWIVLLPTRAVAATFRAPAPGRSSAKVSREAVALPDGIGNLLLGGSLTGGGGGSLAGGGPQFTVHGGGGGGGGSQLTVHGGGGGSQSTVHLLSSPGAICRAALTFSSLDPAALTAITPHASCLFSCPAVGVYLGSVAPAIGAPSSSQRYW